MKIVVLNYAGTVGKTTIAINLLKSRMPLAEVIAVESINETAEGLGVAVDQISGERFREIFLRLLTTEHAIVDVGASNVEAFVDGVSKFDGSHEEVTYFLIPVTPGTKEQIETLSMFKLLLNLGVDSHKIKIVFNRVKNLPQQDFEILFKYAQSEPKLELNPEASIYQTDLFDRLGRQRSSVQAVLEDTTDYRALMRQLDPIAEKAKSRHLAECLADRKQAIDIQKQLDDVYRVLFGVA